MQDFLHIDALLTSEERLVRDQTRRFVKDAVLPKVGDAYENAHFPKEWIKELAALRLLGMSLPETAYGSGASATAYGLMCQELERGDSGLRSFVSVQSALCMFPIFKFGSDEQMLKYLPKMAKGELIGCFGLTEPNAGSDPSSMHTKAEKVLNGYVLNGSKAWITNAPFADLAIVWAKTDAGIRGFIVEAGQPGFSVRKTEHKLSMRASETGELFFEDCFVPEDSLLPKTQGGLSCALKCLTEARFGIAFGAMGAASACYDIALDYTTSRHQFGRPLAANQLVQSDLVTMFECIVKTNLLNLHLARLKDQGLLNFAMVSLAKMTAAKEALHVARLARNLLGANGISLEFHVMRHMNNLETVFTYEGTHNIHQLIIGKEITGIAAF